MYLPSGEVHIRPLDDVVDAQALWRGPKATLSISIT
jgi:hypothetical protein